MRSVLAAGQDTPQSCRRATKVHIRGGVATPRFETGDPWSPDNL